MTKTKKAIVIILSVGFVLVAGGVYLLKSFLSALAPPSINVTRNFISTNEDFINGVTIEKIFVDSIANNNYPIAYTVVYSTSCNIQHPINKPPDPPNKIVFKEPGKYSWDEDTIKVRYIHEGFSRQLLDTIPQPWWLNKFGKYPVCPMKFEKEQWYFITVGNPQVTGIFFYIDSADKEHQYLLPSGVSPI